MHLCKIVAAVLVHTVVFLDMITDLGENMQLLFGKYFVDNEQYHACLQFSVRSQFDTDNYCYH